MGVKHIGFAARHRFDMASVDYPGSNANVFQCFAVSLEAAKFTPLMCDAAVRQLNGGAASDLRLAPVSTALMGTPQQAVSRCSL